MKLVKPGDERPTDPEPAGKVVSMKMGIPLAEEPAAMIMVVLSKQNHIYIGHQPGQDALAHQLCLRGADTLFTITQRALIESATRRVVGVPGNLDSMILPPAPGRDN